MDSNNNYNSGYDFWRDNLLKYGIDEAAGICGRYLDMQVKSELPEIERQFCLEAFRAMYDATASKIIPEKLVYSYDFEKANERAETSYFHKNQSMNRECARAINEAITASNYKVNHYNLEFAAISVIVKHGFERVNVVLAHQIQKHEYDGRYSSANKKWARDFVIPDHSCAFLNSHATLIEDFTSYVRKFYADFEADRFALPGQEEHGEDVHGYTITRSIMIDSNQGYAIGHNPNAVSPYVCWQFYVRDGERSYNWGIYGSEKAAVEGYKSRLFVAFN